jgi:hypothetical protein
MFAHAQQGVVSRCCRFALGGLRWPQAGSPKHQGRQGIKALLVFRGLSYKDS